MLAWTQSSGNAHTLSIGKQNEIDTLEDALAGSYTTKHTVTTRACTAVSELLPRGIENFYLHEHPDTGMEVKVSSEVSA